MAVIRLRKTSKGEKRYQAFIRIKGYKPLMKTFSLRSAAVDWAKSVEVQMKEGKYKEYSDNDYNLVTVTDLINYFDNNVAKVRYSHYDKYKVLYQWWKDKIGNIKIKELSTSHLANCKNILINEKIYKGKTETTRKPNTINKYLMAISAVLTYAVDELQIIDINPMSKIKTLKKPNSRTRFLSDEQIETLALKAKSHSLRTFVFFMLLLKTGGRYNEVRHLQTKDIDRKNNRVYFLDTKNGTHRGVHIDTYMIDLIDNYMKTYNIESGYIFATNRQGSDLAFMKAPMEKIIKDAGLVDFHIHDIRHTFASKMAEEGASLLEIAEALGQKSLTVARLYSHLTLKHTEQVVASVMDKYRF